MKVLRLNKYFTAAALFLTAAAVFVAIALITSLGEFITAAFVISAMVFVMTGIFMLTFSGNEPTAVNLSWALKRIMTQARVFSGSTAELKQFILEQAQTLADEDVETIKRMAEHGAVLINDGDTIIHHCNTGALATVDWGTALGVIRTAHEQGNRVHVLVDETRPRLQGARLTAWELQQYGISFEIITDNMAGYFLQSGQVKSVFFGGDRVAANGDVANKIGSYMLALAAYDNGVPVYSVFPCSTVDLSLSQGLG